MFETCQRVGVLWCLESIEGCFRPLICRRFTRQWWLKGHQKIHEKITQPSPSSKVEILNTSLSSESYLVPHFKDHFKKLNFKLWLFWLTLPFFSRSCAQVEPLDRSSRFMAQTTCFRTRMIHLGIRTMGPYFFVGEYAPTSPPTKNGRE